MKFNIFKHTKKTTPTFGFFTIKIDLQNKLEVVDLVALLEGICVIYDCFCQMKRMDAKLFIKDWSLNEKQLILNCTGFDLGEFTKYLDYKINEILYVKTPHIEQLQALQKFFHIAAKPTV
jgi:hypothetical protein